MNQIKNAKAVFILPIVAVSILLIGCSSSSSDTTPDTSATPSTTPSGSTVTAQSINSDAVTDPMIQNTTQVLFDITVPAYQSDALLVEVYWGDLVVNADWVGDEFWRATAELPIETENFLEVFFFDGNGEITLGDINQTYRTGANAAETVTISAEEFDTDSYDLDEDGVSNIDELRAGTDPSIDEESLLDIRDFFLINNESRFSVSTSFEAAISEERPVFEMLDLVISTDPEEFMRGTTDIDEEGNGTYTFQHQDRSSTLSFDNGTRTRSDNSITWEGRHSSFIDGFQFRADFTNTVTIQDNDTIRFVQEIEGTRGDFYTATWTASSDFTATRIEGTSLCQPVSGTFTETFNTNRTTSGPRITTISKEPDERHWNALQVETGANTTTEFLIRDLFILATPEFELTDAYFICDFVDF